MLGEIENASGPMVTLRLPDHRTSKFLSEKLIYAPSVRDREIAGSNPAFPTIRFNSRQPP